MKLISSVMKELLTLADSYRAGPTCLPELSSRTESLIEQMHASLSSEDFSRAMNSVYLIEDVNAGVLDENRLPNQAENDTVLKNLAHLAQLISGYT